jgi:hypothetical protein
MCMETKERMTICPPQKTAFHTIPRHFSKGYVYFAETREAERRSALHRSPNPVSRVPNPACRKSQISDSRFQIPKAEPYGQSSIDNRKSAIPPRVPFPVSRIPDPESLTPARVCYL